MAVYVLLAFNDDAQAKTFVEDILTYPNDAILTPAQENDVRATVEGVYQKPTKYCECDRHAKGFTRGKNYGWWVCAQCGKPTPLWSRGDMWYTAIGSDLLPNELHTNGKKATPIGWDSPKAWTFLLPQEEVSDNPTDQGGPSTPGEHSDARPSLAEAGKLSD